MLPTHELWCYHDSNVWVMRKNAGNSTIRVFKEDIERVKSVVRVLEGNDAQKHFDLELVNAAMEGRVTFVWVLSNGPASATTTHAFVQRLVRNLRQRRTLRKRVQYRGIWDARFRGGQLVRLYDGLGENRFIDGLPTGVTLIIHDEGIAYLFTPDRPHVVEITSRLVAREQQAYFLKLWEIARKDQSSPLGK